MQNLGLEQVCEKLMKDPVSILLGDLILNGWPDSCKELEDELKSYWIHCFKLSIVDGIILLGEDDKYQKPHVFGSKVIYNIYKDLLRVLHY